MTTPFWAFISTKVSAFISWTKRNTKQITDDWCHLTCDIFLNKLAHINAILCHSWKNFDRFQCNIFWCESYWCLIFSGLIYSDMMFSGVIDSVAMAEDGAELRTVYPQTEAYDSGSLCVSNIHTLKYWQYGNSSGNPVIFMWAKPISITVLHVFVQVNFRIYNIISRGAVDWESLLCILVLSCVLTFCFRMKFNVWRVLVIWGLGVGGAVVGRAE